MRKFDVAVIVQAVSSIGRADAGGPFVKVRRDVGELEGIQNVQ